MDEVPAHIFYGGGKNAIKTNSVPRRSKNNRNSFSNEMFVPDKITVAPGNQLLPHFHQPQDVLRDKPTPPVTNNPVPMPTKLTANEFPFQDTAQDKAEAKKRADSHDSLLKGADSMTALNSSLAVEIDPIRELKNVRRQMGRLATRVLELEDENNRRANREYGFWALLTGSLALVTFLLFKR